MYGERAILRGPLMHPGITEIFVSRRLEMQQCFLKRSRGSQKIT